MKLKAVQLEILWSGGDSEENRNIKFSALSLLLTSSLIFFRTFPSTAGLHSNTSCLSISHPLNRKETYAQYYWESNSKFRKT